MEKNGHFIARFALVAQACTGHLVRPDEKRGCKKLSLGEGVNALEVRWINTGRAEGRAAKRAGLKKGDIVVGMENKPLRLTSQQFNMHVKLNYEVEEKIPLTLLRNGKRIQFDWPLTDGD